MKLQKHCLLALSLLIVDVHAMYKLDQSQPPKGLSWTEHYGLSAMGGIFAMLIPFSLLDNPMKLVACGIVGELLRHRANHLAKQYKKDKVDGTIKIKTDFRPLKIFLCKWIGLLCTTLVCKDALPYLLKYNRTASVINGVDTKIASGMAYASPALASTSKEYHLPSAFLGIFGATGLACYGDKKNSSSKRL